ncbi:hypothetical protein LCI23_13120 [Massilia sp. MS-15]|nr:hypothetical protein [Massilia sp. MS-15]
MIKHLKKSPQWQDMVVVSPSTRMAAGGDHVAPPQGDRWGPGSHIPASVVSPHAKRPPGDLSATLRFR